MSDDTTTKPRRLELWLYGTAGVLAIVGLVIAFGDRPSGEHVEVAEPAAPLEEPEPEPPSATEEESFVPNLPEVPDLATQPPPARHDSEEEEDPRFAQLGAEMRLLSRARELLEEHPAEALGVLEQHRRTHSRGILREEREAFVIEALVSLGRGPDAERRYYDFLRDYPHSSFTPRLRTLMR